MIQRVLFVAFAVVAMNSRPAAAALKVGDPAPKLSIAEWAKGSAVKLSDSADTIYIVEFWATWCPPCRASIPHLTDLQKHFGPKIRIIGVTDEESEVVKRFLKNWDKKMEYTVAIDDDRTTGEAYMEAAGIQTIPHAFLVKGGKLLWHGYPMEVDDKLVELTGDRAWAAIAAKRKEAEEKVRAKVEKLSEHFETERWAEGLPLLDDLIGLEPEQPRWRFTKYYVLATKTKDKAALASYAPRMVEAVADPDALAQFAMQLMQDDEFDTVRDPATAVRAAERAVTLTGRRDAFALHALAAAKFGGGATGDAMRLAQEALAIAEDDELKTLIGKAIEKYRGAAQ